MAKPQRTFSCRACGATYSKWTGRCDSCGEWNTIEEDASNVTALPKGLSGGRGGKAIDLVPLKGATATPPRLATGLQELDRTLGGGLVAGSVVLLGGDPGIGKSTILLQAAARLSQAGRVVYISGEEAVDQVRMRAERLEISDAAVELASATNVRDIAATIDTPDAPKAVIIDSIQTMHLDTVDSAPGTVTQVRTSANELVRLAKARGFALFLVGHVTKEGTMAGPRVLEHMVDTVLYFEGDRGHQFRILRAVKNRFGATDEIGVFEMTGAGLSEVENPSALFLAERRGNVAGSCVFAGIEGSRPVLVEIQALVSPSPPGSPRRAVVGWDSNRLAMVLAVLEARAGVTLSGHDIFLNVAGGLRIQEPAADLAVAAAVLSALEAEPMPADAIVFGEVGLSGEVRAVAQSDARLKEAAKLGFGQGLCPPPRKSKSSAHATTPPLTVTAIGHIQDLVSRFGATQKTP